MAANPTSGKDIKKDNLHGREVAAAVVVVVCVCVCVRACARVRACVCGGGRVASLPLARTGPRSPAAFFTTRAHSSRCSKIGSTHHSVQFRTVTALPSTYPKQMSR